MGKIVAICVSQEKGQQKKPVESAFLRAEHGIVGDAHAGPWHRQVSLLGTESVQRLQSVLNHVVLKPGDFAENILTDGLELFTLPVGTRLRLGKNAVAEVTQIGKECHRGCAIRKAAGDCVMPREGIFVRILVSGEIFPGDTIEIVEQAEGETQ